MKLIKQNAEFKQWHGVLIVAILFIALVLGIVQKLEQQKSSGQIEPHQDLTQATCEDSGGLWNPCGSACRGQEAIDPEIACIELCVEHCYCTSDEQCPADHHCIERIDNVGVCKIEF
ncbi:hypothetical protein KJ673_00410 [Patescibacteria group bacterium]|nr:hypothetical protein [Patescibacteria group bacterium]MBU4452905.1 hypothetical protein [Patescibacteria group bacterium]MCG2687219.1 hypothetical protein [Candidatus Parcubacteria bacterium]